MNAQNQARQLTLFNQLIGLNPSVAQLFELAKDVPYLEHVTCAEILRRDLSAWDLHHVVERFPFGRVDAGRRLLAIGAIHAVFVAEHVPELAEKALAMLTELRESGRDEFSASFASDDSIAHLVSKAPAISERAWKMVRKNPKVSVMRLLTMEPDTPRDVSLQAASDLLDLYEDGSQVEQVEALLQGTQVDGALWSQVVDDCMFIIRVHPSLRERAAAIVMDHFRSDADLRYVHRHVPEYREIVEEMFEDPVRSLMEQMRDLAKKREETS
ncbi:MAG: hypothetical protein ABIH41_04915 [Nanoarchaeota archaeon]